MIFCSFHEVIHLLRDSSKLEMQDNSFLASSEFCCLLIIFANCLDQGQYRQNVRPDQDPNCLTL